MSRELSGAIPSMKPKLHVIVKDMFLTVRGFFIPFFMIGVCLTLSAAAIAVTVLVMIILERWTMVDSASLHSVGIAIITGIAASGFISVVIEGGNNYRWNQRRQLILSNYLRAVSSYEFNIQGECVHPLIQVCQYYHIKLDETKYCGLLDEENFDEEFEEEPELPNRFVMLAEEYAKLYPILQEVYTNDKEYLKQREIDVLERLFNADQTIRRTYITELTYLCHEQQKGPKRTQWAVLHKLFPDSLERTALEIELEQEVAHFVDVMMQHTYLQEEVNETLLKGVDISVQHLYGGIADENWEEHGGYDMVTDALLEALHILDGATEEDTCTDEQREKERHRHRQFISRRLSEAYQEIDTYLSMLRKETLKEPCYWVEGVLTKGMLEQNTYCLQEIQNQCQSKSMEESEEFPDEKA